jgi:hypothetical protein
VNTALCLAGYGLAVAVLAPRVLTRTAGAGWAPRLGVTGWLLAMITAAGSVLAAAAALARSINPWLATSGLVLLALALGRPAGRAW